MRCNNCGWENPDGSQKCEKCNATLLHFKQCLRGHFYSADLEKCPYCTDESDLRKRLSGISEEDIFPFPMENAMCYCQEPPDWGKHEAHREHRQLVGWLINTKKEASDDYKLFDGRNVIGCDVSCDIYIQDSQVSSKHAIVVFRNDRFSIMDNMSSRGTFVNDKDIESEKIELHDGDIIKVGETVLRFCSHADDEHKESLDDEHNENEKI